MAKRAAKKNEKKVEKARPAKKGRRGPRLSQAKLPRHTLPEALRVATAIADQLRDSEAASHQVAMALNISPTSSTWRTLSGAAVGYGLTNGAYNADTISLTDLGRRCVAPTEDNEDLVARTQAALVPEVLSGFFSKYNRAKFPSEKIAKNVLSHNFGVPTDRVEDAYKLLKTNGEFAGILIQTKTGLFVSVDSPQPPTDPGDGAEDGVDEQLSGGDSGDDTGLQGSQPLPENRASTGAGETPASASGPPEVVNPGLSRTAMRRVFITHGKNREFIDPIKQLLGFGELEPVVAIEKHGVSLPVPDKVMNDMRSCGAAIIHVDSEARGPDGEESAPINPNVLIEIGAAMALYGRRFILLVRKGVKLPSNLQGLLEVRYEGESLDGNATIKLLQAITDIKNHEMPARYSDVK